MKSAPSGESEAAPLRCLSDVVDAGDRNYEIEIAEDRRVASRR